MKIILMLKIAEVRTGLPIQLISIFAGGSNVKM